MPIFRSRRFGWKVNTESILGTARRDGNCITTFARRVARRLAGHSICVQISLVSQLGVSTTANSRVRLRRSGRRKCTLGQRCPRAFSISRGLGRFRAPVREAGARQDEGFLYVIEASGRVPPFRSTPAWVQSRSGHGYAAAPRTLLPRHRETVTTWNTRPGRCPPTNVRPSRRISSRKRARCLGYRRRLGG